MYQSSLVTGNTDSVNSYRLRAAAQYKLYIQIHYNSHTTIFMVVKKKHMLTANQESMHRMVVTQTIAAVTKAFKIKQSVK